MSELSAYAAKKRLCMSVSADFESHPTKFSSRARALQRRAWFRRFERRTYSIIESAEYGVSYAYDFHRSGTYTHLLQTSVQTREENAAISSNARFCNEHKTRSPPRGNRKVPVTTHRRFLSSVSAMLGRRFYRRACEACTADCSQIPFTVNDLCDRVTREICMCMEKFA